MVSHLKGDALTWWRSYSNDNVEVFDELTLDVLIDVLREQFSIVDREMKLRDRLLKLKQLMNVQTYVNTFRKL